LVQVLLGYCLVFIIIFILRFGRAIVVVSTISCEAEQIRKKSFAGVVDKGDGPKAANIFAKNRKKYTTIIRRIEEAIHPKLPLRKNLMTLSRYLYYRNYQITKKSFYRYFG
jgi:hypothetical protein